MQIAGSTVLVTGASRGLGKSLVEGALRQGAKRIYAGVRQSFVHADKRVTPLTLDVTSAAQIRAAVGQVDALDILINNAGISLQNDLRDRAALDRLLAVNLFGTYDVTQAFLPVLARPRSAIVNILSLAGLAAVPFDSLYSISKAATFSLSQSLRALLAGGGVSVHVVLPGPIDTVWYEAWIFRRPLRSLSPKQSSMAWKMARRKSSPTRCLRRSQTAGAAVP